MHEFMANLILSFLLLVLILLPLPPTRAVGGPFLPPDWVCPALARGAASLTWSACAGRGGGSRGDATHVLVLYCPAAIDGTDRRGFTVVTGNIWGQTLGEALVAAAGVYLVVQAFRTPQVGHGRDGGNGAVAPTKDNSTARRHTSRDAPTRRQVARAPAAGATLLDSVWDSSTPLLLPLIIHQLPAPSISDLIIVSDFVGMKGSAADTGVEEPRMVMIRICATAIPDDSGRWQGPPASHGSAAHSNDRLEQGGHDYTTHGGFATSTWPPDLGTVGCSVFGATSNVLTPGAAAPPPTAVQA